MAALTRPPALPRSHLPDAATVQLSRPLLRRLSVPLLVSAMVALAADIVDNRMGAGLINTGGAEALALVALGWASLCTIGGQWQRRARERP